MQEFEDAKDKVMMGAERSMAGRGREEDDRLSRSGPALVSLNEPADPIHKATIIPRSRAGHGDAPAERDSYSYHRDKMHANLAVAMGGRVAEEIIFGHDKVSSGASGDIQYATDPARNMAQMGHDDVGPRSTRKARKAISAWANARTMAGATPTS